MFKVLKRTFIMFLITMIFSLFAFANPTELLIKFKSNPNLPAYGTMSLSSVSQVSGIESLNQKYGLQDIQTLYPSKTVSAFKASSLAENTRRFPLRAARAPKGMVAPDLSHTYKLAFPLGVNIEELASEYSSLSGVEYAEPNRIYKLNAITPNDPSYNVQWALPKMEANEAWVVATGSTSIIVAIVDSGINYNHQDLQNRIWQNTVEINGTPGIDNDGNGFIDDFRGWDFVDISNPSNVAAGEDGVGRDNDPMDVQGHGSHVSGIIGAEANNSIGIAGLDWNCKLMPVRAGYLNVSGNGSLETDDIVAAITYAVDNGADVINMSFGGPGFSSAINTALQYALANGVVLVAAAGNDGQIGINFPANQTNVIAVGAVTDTDSKSSYSNTGTELFVVAPGDDIYSTITGNQYDLYSGTSMATPYVSALSALLLGVSSSITVSKVRDILAETSDDLGTAGRDDSYGNGRINVKRAINKLQSVPVLALNSFIVVQVTENGGLVNISGTVTDPSLVSFSISYSVDALTWESSGITLTRNGLVTVNDSLLAQWSISAIPSETVWIMLQAKQIGEKLTSKLVTVNLIAIGVGDIVAPTLSIIKFDDLQIVTADYVDVTPVISFSISDNVQLSSWLLEAIDVATGLVTASESDSGLTIPADSISWRMAFETGTYYLRVTVTDLVGNSTTRLSPEFEVKAGNLLDRVLAAPNPYYPNQGGSLYIGATLSRPSTLRCVIHALNGEDIFRHTAEVPAGYYEFVWDGKDLTGDPVANGVYLAYVRSKNILGEVLVKVLKIAVVR